MPQYTFHTLSDADFEDLACDLIGVHLGVSFQSFAKGRDSGIDLLYGARVVGATIVQCKHYSRSTFAQLKAAIANEATKAKRIQPSRYIVVTSFPLTPNNKEDLLSLLTPYCHGIDDIYGASDLNSLLRQHPDIERR